jgi:hypothetical protein
LFQSDFDHEDSVFIPIFWQGVLNSSDAAHVQPRRDTTLAIAPLTMETTMFRKIALGLAAAASLGAAALLPSAASASPLYVGWGWGWGPSYNYIASPSYVVGTPMIYGDPCLQKRLVQTNKGMRWRTVNVCF